jgi:acyl-CoA-binding protein
MKQKSLSLSIVTTIALIILIIVTAFTLIERQKTEVKNTYLYFNNAARGDNNETSPVIVSIDGNIIYSSNDIGKAEAKSVALPESKHTITISNINKGISTTKSFTIKKDKEAYVYISYHHNPGYEVYLPFYRKNYLEHLAQKNKNINTLSTQRKIDSLIDINYIKKTGYKPEKPSFKIHIQDYQYLID